MDRDKMERAVADFLTGLTDGQAVAGTGRCRTAGDGPHCKGRGRLFPNEKSPRRPLDADGP